MIRILAVALLCAAPACNRLQRVAPSEPQNSTEDVSEDVSEDVAASPSEDTASLPTEDIAAPLSEDASEPPPEVEAPRTYRFLIVVMTLPWEVSPGVARGFDLDGIVSDGYGAEDCSWEDFEAPDGTPGIDNQMALLTPLFEPAGLGQAFEYLENSIEDSGFFHLFELRDVDDLVDDAEVELTSKSGKRAVPINDFFQDAFETRREPEEMMTEIRVPPLPEGAGWDYQKFCLRRGFDIAVVGVAAVVERDGDTVRSARIAVGAARPTPFRHPETEALLSGRTFSEDLCRAAAEKVTDGLDGITDVRASGKYRVHLTRVLVRRALEAAFQRASG